MASGIQSVGVGGSGQRYFMESLETSFTTGESGLTRNLSLWGEATTREGEGGEGTQFRIASASVWVRDMFVAIAWFDSDEKDLFG